MIKVKNVSKKFKDKTILNNISLEFEKNKIYGIVGTNGSGKSVLLKIILGLMKPNSGEIEIDGKILGKNIRVIENVGAVIETPSFYEDLTALENLIEIANINKKIGKDRIIELMDYFELDHTSKKSIKKYSLGMRQKTALIQAFMEYPKVIILDEPTNGLDENNVSKLHELIKKSKTEDTTILITSHNKYDIETLCDEVFEMREGSCYAKEK